MTRGAMRETRGRTPGRSLISEAKQPTERARTGPRLPGTREQGRVPVCASACAACACRACGTAGSAENCDYFSKIQMNTELAFSYSIDSDHE